MIERRYREDSRTAKPVKSAQGFANLGPVRFIGAHGPAAGLRKSKSDIVR